jgi:hypothetical protein
MDIINRFSIEDFLAYLFPGMIGTLGICILLLLTPIKDPLLAFPTDITTGIVFLVLSYIIGILLSGLVERRLGGPLKEPILLHDDIKRAVIEAYKDTFKISKETQMEWPTDYYYSCRSLVVETMPNALPSFQRQSGLRQLRMNIIPSLCIWLVAGMGWGIWGLINNQLVWGSALIVVSIGLFWWMATTTIDRMNHNQKRAVREVMTAFLAGYVTGAFKGKGKKKSWFCGN